MLEALRSRRLSLGPKLPRVRAPARAHGSGAGHVSAVASGTAALHLCDPCRRRASRATRWSRRRSASSPRPTASSTRARRPVFCDIDPLTLNIDPRAAAAAVGERTSGLLPVHIFGYPADMPGARGAGSRAGPVARRGRLRGARGRVHADGCAVGARGEPRHLRLLSEQAARPRARGEPWWPIGGGEGADRQRAQPGPRARHGVARPRPSGLQLPPVRSGLRARAGAARAARRDARRPRPGRPPLRRGAGRRRGADLPCADAGGDRRSWFVYVVQLPAEVDRDERDRRAACSGAWTRSPTSLRST